MDTSIWLKGEKFEYSNSDFGELNFPNPNDEFSAELSFTNCTIEALGAACMILNKRISIKNCKIGYLGFYATYFFGGLELINCEIGSFATFDSGVHNIAPNKFIMEANIFNCYVDFFDIWFGGPVSIINNTFNQGTNIGIYLKPPVGIKEGVDYQIENNKGNIYLYADDDPLKPRT